MTAVAEKKVPLYRSGPGGSLKNLRILVLATTFPRWKNDTEPRFVFDLTRQLARKVPLWVLVPHSPGAKMEEELEGVRIIRFPYIFPKRLQSLCYEGGVLPKLKSRWSARLQLPFFLMAQCLSIWRMVRKYKINFIHCHWVIPQGFFVSILNLFTGIPYLLTAHGGDVYSFRGNSLIKKLSRFALGRARLCTVNSRPTGQAVCKIHPEAAIRIIPMGVDTRQFHPGKYNAKLKKSLNIHGSFLLAVGRFVEKKGFKYLLAAMPEIVKRQPETKLVMIGFGPQEEELNAMVRRLKLDGAVIFAGSKWGNELAKYFATADIFIGPSVVTESGDTEGQGVVFLEAMASETAVIASDVGGIKDIVRDMETGILVPQKSPEAIAEKTLLLLENPQLRNQLAYNGKKLAENKYSWEKTAEKFLETIDQINMENPYRFRC